MADWNDGGDASSVGDDEPRSRVISAQCFRLLTLQAEIQNDVEVLKPILNELEVLRLSAALGMLSSVDAKLLESNQLEARKFDDDFARFLRSDVLGLASSSSDGSNAAAAIRVVGLFGKQQDIKQHLQRLKLWDGGMERHLDKRDQGICAVLVPKELPADSTVFPTLILFGWLQDAVFHAERLRDTPTYIMRFLTCLTNDVTCCLSEADAALMESIAESLNGGMDGSKNQLDDWKSYSVAFCVEQQRDQEDDVKSWITQLMTIPSEFDSARDVGLVKGAMPALFGIVSMPGSKRQETEHLTFHTVAAFHNWIKIQGRDYEMRADTHKWTLNLKLSLLQHAGLYPHEKTSQVEMARINELQRLDEALQDEQELWMHMNRTQFEACADTLFRIHSESDRARVNDAMNEITNLIESLRSEHRDVRIPKDTNQGIEFYKRLGSLLAHCFELFQQSEVEKIDELVKKAHAEKHQDSRGSSISSLWNIATSFFSSEKSVDPRPSVTTTASATTPTIQRADVVSAELLLGDNREDNGESRGHEESLEATAGPYLLMDQADSLIEAVNQDPPPSEPVLTQILIEFQHVMQRHLQALKLTWLAHVETFMECFTPARKADTERAKKAFVVTCNARFAAIVDEALDGLFTTRKLDASSHSGKRLRLQFSVRPTRKPTAIPCEIKKEVWTADVDRVVVWRMKPAWTPSGAVSSEEEKEARYELDRLGATDLVPGETILGVYSTHPQSILLVTLKPSGTSVRRVLFPSDSWQRTEPVMRHIREFGKIATLSDYYAKDRVLALVGPPNRVNLYRFNDTFTSLEVMRSVDVSVKTSLAVPLREVLLSDNVLYMVDEHGALQSLNTRSQQTSRKHSILPPNTALSKSRCGPVFVADEGGVLGWLHVDDKGTPQLRVLSVDDMRELPQSVCMAHGVEKNAFDSCGHELITTMIGDTTDTLFVVDLTGRKVYIVRVDATLKSDTFRIRTSNNVKGAAEHDVNMTPEIHRLAEHWLWTLYHLYEKFPVRGELYRVTQRVGRTVATLEITFACDSDTTSAVRDGCQEALREIMSKLEHLNKPLYGMDLGSRVEMFSGENVTSILDAHYRRLEHQPLAVFLRELITFVPIQICRAEHNSLTLMSDGQDKSYLQTTTEGLQSAAIAQSIRFGLLSPLLQSSREQCLVITSMGKQSTGKSYFLNHLTGTSFAISGARCTDGAWMSVRVLPPNDTLLVVIDFEGLGSFERTEQEDVFLSVLNASVSMLTIFRMEMRLDKEIDELFAKFQKGSQLIQNDPRLFRGKLYMSVKDVNPNDQRGVVREFVTKFQRMLAANREKNFLSDMYAGQLEINCSPPLGTSGYYRSLSQAQKFIMADLCGNPKAGFPTGKEFLDCLRLLLAKISILDWTSLDDSAIQMRVSEAVRQLPSAIRYGAHVVGSETNGNQSVPAAHRDDLVNIKTGENITISLDEVCAADPQRAGAWRKLISRVPIDALEDDTIDFGSALASEDTERASAASAALSTLFEMFTQVAMADPSTKSIKDLQHDFDLFLAFAVRRRCLRVQRWSYSLFGDRAPDQWTQLEKQALNGMQTLFVRCLDRCSSCQLGCMLVSAHGHGENSHDCRTNHSCDGVCAYCSDANVEEAAAASSIAVCNKPAGHEGLCECGVGDHTCKQPCHLNHAINCGKRCSKKAGHTDNDVHVCSVQLHKCGQPCAAPGCTRVCVHDVEEQHVLHKCEVERCLARCVMDGCDHQCTSTDHFHGAHHNGTASAKAKSEKLQQRGDDASAVVHMCSDSHACLAMCDEEGICHIDVFLKQSSRTFVGARGTFQYTFQEMNGSRKKCARRLKPGQMTHSGKHTCEAVATQAVDEEEKQGVATANRVVHYCNVRCPCCSYFCQKAFGHDGSHSTSHGNMRNTMFLSEDHEIDVMDRKYAAGERGTAEMCNLYCSKMGRAHVHYLDCDQGSEAKCVYSGSNGDKRRHCTRHLEPKPDKEQDEVLHEHFWDTLGWEDPCSSLKEREEFSKCGFKCDAAEHEGEEHSYCVLPAWHAPEKAPRDDDGFSYIDGHKFECNHVAPTSKMHHVFVLDASGSMKGDPWNELLAAFRGFVANRIAMGAVFDLVSVITFDDEAKIIWEAAPITQVGNKSIPFSGYRTFFAVGLRCANEVLSRTHLDEYKPVLVFFSDGQPWDGPEGETLAAHITHTYGKNGLEAFAVGFGDVNLSVLERVAQGLGGNYVKALTGAELQSTFRSISASLGTRAGLALTRPIHEMLCVICQKELAAEATTVLSPCQHELHQRCYASLAQAAPADSKTLNCPTCRRTIKNGAPLAHAY